MKTTIQWLLKAIAAGILALVISSAVCLVYYNPGIHITNKTGATDYVWQSNSFTGTMTEGVAWNYTDKNGYFNENCIDENMNVLIMGSSQMEGRSVFQKQNTSYMLEKLTNKTVYNIGISGHDLLTCVKNLESALKVMKPAEYVIIETGTTRFSEEAIDKCISGNMENIPSYDSGILFHLQKILYLKLVHTQLKSWNGIKANDVPDTGSGFDAVQLKSGNEAKADDAKPESAKDAHTSDSAMLSDSYNKLMQKIRETCDAYKVQPIILYHPHLSVNADGTIAANDEGASLESFQSACQANDVIFVDMTEDFINMYNEDYILPYGFCNTSVGVGHLNQFGHKAIAKRLAKIISAAFSVTEN